LNGPARLRRPKSQHFLSPAETIVEECSDLSRLPSLHSAAWPALTAPALSPVPPLCRTGQEPGSDRTSFVYWLMAFLAAEIRMGF
jgi:hypothetical protein